MKRILSIAVIVAVAFVLSFTLIPATFVSGQQVVTATSPSPETFSEILKKQVPKGVPILENISVTTPSSDVPTELAGFSGAWVGEWYGERTNSYMADQLIVFEKISPNSVTVVSGGIGRFVGGSYTNFGQTWSGRSTLSLEREGVAVVMTTPSGYTLTYKIEGKKLRARSASTGGAWVGTFEKVR